VKVSRGTTPDYSMMTLGMRIYYLNMCVNTYAVVNASDLTAIVNIVKVYVCGVAGGNTPMKAYRPPIRRCDVKLLASFY
jgi:hypothetical protein